MNNKYKIHNETGGIEILEGEFSGTIYKYGKVSFTEDDGNDKLIMHFDYDIINDKKFDGPDFHQFIGDILIDIMEKQLAAGEVVYTGGTDDNSDRAEDSYESDTE